jgi:hypothetical protein
VTAAALPPHSRRLLPAGWPVYVALAALALVLAVAGVPGRDRVAGDGSEKLRHGWAEQRAQAADAAPAREPAPSAPR